MSLSHNIMRTPTSPLRKILLNKKISKSKSNILTDKNMKIDKKEHEHEETIISDTTYMQYLTQHNRILTIPDTKLRFYPFSPLPRKLANGNSLKNTLNINTLYMQLRLKVGCAIPKAFIIFFYIPHFLFSLFPRAREREK